MDLVSIYWSKILALINHILDLNVSVLSSNLITSISSKYEYEKNQ